VVAGRAAAQEEAAGSGRRGIRCGRAGKNFEVPLEAGIQPNLIASREKGGAKRRAACSERCTIRRSVLLGPANMGGLVTVNQQPWEEGIGDRSRTSVSENSVSI
jgi:hypothetical protein